MGYFLSLIAAVHARMYDRSTVGFNDAPDGGAAPEHAVEHHRRTPGYAPEPYSYSRFDL
jgi:hypothetical protein